MLHAHQSAVITHYYYYSAIEQTILTYKKLQPVFIVHNQLLLLNV